jgi:hypothetical protein
LDPNAENIPYQKMYTKIGDALGLKKQFRPAPKVAGQIDLYSAGMLKGNTLGLEVLKSAYNTSSYDNTKSLQVEGFDYRPLKKPSGRCRNF